MSKTESNGRVVLTRPESVKHFQIANMPITGMIVAIDHDHVQGQHSRPYLIRFDDGRDGWYARWEFKAI